jgi:hypothetical protein
MRTSRTLSLVATAAVALLIATATPAAANGPFPIDVVAGSFNSVFGTFDLTPGSQGSPPCTEKPTTLAMTFDGTAGSGTWTISGTKSRQRQIPAGLPTADWYQIDVTYLSPPSGGAYAAVGSPPPTDTLTGQMIIRIDLYRIGPAQNPNCAKTIPVCRITGLYTISSGTFVGNPLPGDTLDLTSTSGPLVVSQCIPPFNALNNTVATLDQDIVFQ